VIRLSDWQLAAAFLGIVAGIVVFDYALVRLVAHLWRNR
jgi:hypothetical protein